MISGNPFWDYWYFHIPNYIIAALIYTLLGRMLLGLFVSPDWHNYIWRAFCRLTDPVLNAAGAITPDFVTRGLLPLVAIFWLLVIRFAYWAVLGYYGLAPSLGLQSAS